jgi:hypothetical protein
LGKPYGIKLRCYLGAIVRNTLRNLLRISWERNGNTLGIRGKNKKIPTPPPQEEKTTGPLVRAS